MVNRAVNQPVGEQRGERKLAGRGAKIGFSGVPAGRKEKTENRRGGSGGFVSVWACAALRGAVRMPALLTTCEEFFEMERSGSKSP